MAIHKKEAFTQKEQELAEFAKALAHPARIAILKLLAQKNECICGEIVEVLPLSQSDRKSTRLNPSHPVSSRMPSSA